MTFEFTKGTSQKSVYDILKPPQVYVHKFFELQHINYHSKEFHNALKSIVLKYCIKHLLVR